MNLPAKTATATIVFLLCAASLMQVLAGYAGDKNWLLLAARTWLGGGRLYVDSVEVNPPLIVWLYAIPVWISLYLPFLTDYNALALIGLVSCALSVWLSMRLIRLHPAFENDKRRQNEFALGLAALLVFFTGPVYFFDREHIMLVFAFPYILRFMPSLARRPVPQGLRLATGCMAALAFCIKPYMVIPFAALQLIYLLRERSLAILWAVENIIIYLAAAAYLACIYVLAPEYIHIVFPMALATYFAFSRRLFGVFYCILAFLTAGISLADFRPRFHTPYRRDVYYFLGVSLGFLAYALANNGWGYTYHPLICMLLFLTGWLTWEYGWLKNEQGEKGLPVRQFLFGQRACAINLAGNAAYMLYLMAVFFVTPPCDWSSDCVKNRPYLEYLQEHHIQSFGAFSEDFHKWPSLARLSGAHFETRYNALWMVPQLVREDEASLAKHQWIISNVAMGLADDLARRKPEVVFVDNSPKFFGYDFAVDLPAFFSGVPEFKEAWGHYRYADTIDRCREDAASLTGCRYAIYKYIP
jgi:hypothetical protein